MNDEPPEPPPGLNPAQAYRWRIAHRHLVAAEHTDINNLDEAGRTRHFGRLRATVDDLLRLARELSKPETRPPDDESDVL